MLCNKLNYNVKHQNLFDAAAVVYMYGLKNHKEITESYPKVFNLVDSYVNRIDESCFKKLFDQLNKFSTSGNQSSGIKYFAAQLIRLVSFVDSNFNKTISSDSEVINFKRLYNDLNYTYDESMNIEFKVE